MPCSQQYKQVAKTSKHVVLCIFILQDAADLTSLLCSFQKIHLFMNLRVGSSIICIQLLFSLALEVTKTKCNSNIEYQLYFKVACFHQFCLSQLYYIEKINCVVIFDNIFSTYLCAQLCLTVIPLTIVPQAPLWHIPGKFTRAGCHFLLQGIFLTQGQNPHLIHILHW